MSEWAMRSSPVGGGGEVERFFSIYFVSARLFFACSSKPVQVFARSCRGIFFLDR